MGTNYYWRTRICDSCGRYDELHIGKKSYGWRFSFRAHEFDGDRPDIRSFDDWNREFLARGAVADEYGEIVSVARFLAMVVESREGNLNHYAEGAREGYNVPGRDWMDADGWSFSLSEFF